MPYLKHPLVGARHPELPPRVLMPVHGPDGLSQVAGVGQHDERRRRPRLEVHLLHAPADLVEEAVGVCGLRRVVGIDAELLPPSDGNHDDQNDKQ